MCSGFRCVYRLHRHHRRSGPFHPACNRGPVLPVYPLRSLRQTLLDKLIDIEVDEISAAGPDRLPAKRGQLASDLITLLCYPEPEPEEI